MAHDTAYDALNDVVDDARWAFGTGFEDPLAGVDTAVPDGVNGDDLAAYCLMLGDDALVLSHRLQEWTTRLPELEEEAAVANIALDLLGQARLLLTRAGRADGSDRDDDYYAFTREQDGFRNVRLVEAADGDFAELIARLLIFSSWRLELLDELRGSADPVLAAIAAKGVMEVTYHRDWAAQWAVRLGDGTELSNARMQTALDTIWPLVDELFEVHPIEARLVGVAADPSQTRERVYAVLNEVFQAAMLIVPTPAPLATVRGPSGRDGVHTQELGDLLAELQSVARAHPDATW
jgi:ring-1,2-phenylacetyl-CoA epoxidase subunit PaaC